MKWLEAQSFSLITDYKISVVLKTLSCQEAENILSEYGPNLEILQTENFVQRYLSDSLSRTANTFYLNYSAISN